MPELPEVEALVGFLTERAVGRVVARVDVAALSVLKTYDPPVTSLQGLEVASVSRHGKFLDLDVSGLHLVVHLARAGWLRWSEALSPVPPPDGQGAARPPGCTWTTGRGFDLTEAGTQKRLAVYVVHSPYDVPGVARLGPDPLSPGFGVPELAGMLAGSRQQLKGLLRDQSVLAGVGNAYSDEVLHAARLSPFRLGSSLSEQEVAELFDALQSVLRDAVARADGLAAGRAEEGEEDRDAGARAHRAALPGVRRHRAGGLLRRLLAAVLPDLPDRRQAARRPPAVPPAQVSPVTPSPPRGNRGLIDDV